MIQGGDFVSVSACDILGDFPECLIYTHYVIITFGFCFNFTECH